MSKILIIEDEPDVLDNLVELMELNGYSVLTANNGLDGIELANQHLPDLIISDLMMPGLTGFDVLESLKKNPQTYFIPFIFLTAQASENTNRQGLMLGADAYITKPYKNECIVTVVKSKIEKMANLKLKTDSLLDELRHNITYSIPHELRTPLNGIMGFTSILLNDFDAYTDEEKIEMLEQIQTSSIRLNRIISNFILYTKLQTIEVICDEYHKYRTFSPSSILNEYALNYAEKHLRRNDVKINLCNEDTSLFISEHDFIKIVQELMDNAIKFSNCGTPIVIVDSIDEDYYTLNIKNFGSYITEENISKIGGFFQFDRKILEQQGIGLGLAIVKRITEIYSGQFDISSQTNNDVSAIVKLKIYK